MLPGSHTTILLYFCTPLIPPLTQTTPFLSFPNLLSQLTLFASLRQQDEKRTPTLSYQNSDFLLILWMNWQSSYLSQLLHWCTRSQLLRNSSTLFHIFPLTRTIPVTEICCHFSNLKISLELTFPSSYCLTSPLPFKAKPLQSTV